MDRRRGIGEVLRSSQKDGASLDTLRRSVTGVGIGVLGAETWILHERWFDSCVKFIYYALTTLSDYQTLGEEYTGIIQCTRKLKLPSKSLRFASILIKSFGPRIVDVIIEKFQIGNPDKSIELESLKKCISFLESVHTCLFYFQGIFFDISKRLTGIEYVKIKPHDGQDNKKAFRILGYVASINLMLTLGFHIYRFIKQRKEESVSQHSSDIKCSNRTNISSEQSSLTCSLCLDPVGTRGCAASTSCGHLGCWTCLLETATISGECPLCRTSLSANQIIPLQNL